MAKKEIKGLEKELFDDHERAEIWFAENWKKCIVGAVVLILVVSGFFVWKHFDRKNFVKAGSELSAATAKNIDAVAKKYPKHPGVAFNRIRVASELMAAKDFKAAREQFRKVVSDGSAPAFFQDIARKNAAICAENSGDIDTAIKEFQQIADANSADSAECGFHAASLLLNRGKIKDAEARFEKVAKTKGATDTVQNPWVIQSQIALKAIAKGDFDTVEK